MIITFMPDLCCEDLLIGGNGTAHTVGAIDLEANNFFTEFPPQVVDDSGNPVAITAQAQALPQMNGSGMVRNMRAARVTCEKRVAINSVACHVRKQSFAATFGSQNLLKNGLLACQTASVISTTALSACCALTSPLGSSAQKPNIATTLQCGWRCAESNSFHRARLRQYRFCASCIQTKDFLVKTPMPHALHGWQDQDEFRVAGVWTPTH